MAVKLVLFFALIMIGVLEIPQFPEIKIEKINIQGEVKGEESRAPAPTPSPPPSLHPSPSPPANIPSPTPTPDLRVKEKIADSEPTSIILVKDKELIDQEIKIDLPLLDPDQTYALAVNFDLITVEDDLGFDNPALVIKLDDRPIYQQSAKNNYNQELLFNPRLFSSQPDSLTIWSGNTGDDLKDTLVHIKTISLIPSSSTSMIETTPINDLSMVVDNENYLTLEWSSPQTNDKNFKKALAYEIRYAKEEITTENWSQSQVVTPYLPKISAPHSSKSLETILIEAPPLDSGYMAIRSLDSSGSISPLGRNIFFKIINS